MSRCKHIVKRKILPDEKFGDMSVSKFINIMMSSGKKSIARKTLYTAFDNIREKTKKDSIEVFKNALNNVKPIVEVKSRRIGGATYQVPIEVTDARGRALAMRWIVMFARNRPDKTMALRLSAELVDAYNKTGNAYKKKDDTHRMAEANKAFAHFRW